MPLLGAPETNQTLLTSICRDEPAPTVLGSSVRLFVESPAQFETATISQSVPSNSTGEIEAPRHNLIIDRDVAEDRDQGDRYAADTCGHQEVETQAITSSKEG